MNFDTSVEISTNLDRFDVGRVFTDDEEKLKSDLIGINLEDVEKAMENLVNEENENEFTENNIIKVFQIFCQVLKLVLLAHFRGVLNKNA